MIKKWKIIIGLINPAQGGVVKCIKANYYKMNYTNFIEQQNYCTSGVIEKYEGKNFEMTKYKIRKFTPRECFRLMDMDNEDITKIQNAGVSRTQQHKMAGNSIVVSCLEHILEQLFFPVPLEDCVLQFYIF